MTDSLHLSPPISDGVILAVASGKGGVGKTWLSITLSHALAQSGADVLLFDGDLGLANVDIQLGLAPQQDLGAVLDDKVTLENAVFPYAAGGFDILAGHSGSGNLASLPIPRLVALRRELQELSRRYDVTILDLGAGVDRPVRLMAGMAQASLVVTTDEPTALTDAYAFIKLARAENVEADMRVVVNMAASTAEGEATHAVLRRTCESFLSYTPSLAGIIRRDSHVRESIRAQSPLLERFSGCDAAKDVQALALQLRRAFAPHIKG